MGHPALRSHAGLRVFVTTLTADHSDSWWPLRIEISPGPRAAIGSRKAAKVTATWNGDRVPADTVKAVVRVTR